MDDLKIICLTSDYYSWACGPFSYLFNRYWGTEQEVIIAGFTPIDKPLPANFKFYSIASENYPADKWSNALIKLLQSGVTSDYFVLLLEDYWLTRRADVRAVKLCMQYIQDHKDVLRIDLTDDRQYAGGRKDVDSIGPVDIIETPFETPYQMSFQAGIWSKRHMLNIIKPHLTAWETEIYTQPPADMRVLGTRQRPLRYANGINKGRVDVPQLELIPEPHRGAVISMIPPAIYEARKG